MNKFKILVFLIAFPILVFAQPKTNNNANPYTNPYTNPYLDGSQNTNNNFFDKLNQDKNNQNAGDKKNSQNVDDKKNNQNNTNNNQNQLDENQFKDLNSTDTKNGDLYKSDVDYMRYLNSTISKEQYDAMVIAKDSLYKDSLLTQKSPSKRIYGANFFSNNVFDLSDKNVGTPPLDYRLGPGDEVIVNVWGNAEIQQSYVIGKDGTIFPSRAGRIYLQGLTFEAAANVIKSKFRKFTSNSSIDVQMGRSRTIKVTILGEVKTQGTYSISAFNTALNALFKAGGINEIGNLRKIEIKRDGRTVDVIDLYQYLQKGKNAEEVYLEDNDYIYVDVYEKLVKADGMFKRPMYYQLTADEGLKDLINFAGGATFNARNSLLHIKTVINEEESYVDIPGKTYFDENSYDDYILKDGDVVSLNPINEGLSNVVSIEGAVKYPENYEVLDGKSTLSKIIAKAGGLTSNAYLPKAYLYRAGNQQETDAIKVDLRNLEGNDIEIKIGDKIRILSTSTFEEKYRIEVIGNVRKPGSVPFYKNMKLKDALLLCGGLSLDAESGRIEISNVVDSLDKYSITSKNGTNVRIISINANLEIDETSENIVLKPLDRVYVRRKVDFLPYEKIQLYGEINYPGEYVLVQKNEKLSSVIKRCGGISNTAFAEGAKLVRANIGQIVIDLPDALKNIGGKSDIILQNNDIIIIPSVNDVVSVRGEVQSPINIKFDKDFADVNYYIGAAGGYGERPWRSRINVRYQNGRMKKTKNFLFIHLYPTVKAGSVVTVPTKPAKINRTRFSDVFATSMASISSLATLYILGKSAGIFK